MVPSLGTFHFRVVSWVNVPWEADLNLVGSTPLAFGAGQA